MHGTGAPRGKGMRPERSDVQDEKAAPSEGKEGNDGGDLKQPKKDGKVSEIEGENVRVA